MEELIDWYCKSQVYQKKWKTGRKDGMKGGREGGRKERSGEGQKEKRKTHLDSGFKLSYATMEVEMP